VRTIKKEGSVPHPLVEQLRFARAEFQRGLEGVTPVEAQERFLPMNCISWNVGHLTWQEQRYWLSLLQGQTPYPDINGQFANGAPACTPQLDEILDLWRKVTALADPFLDTLTTEQLQADIIRDGQKLWFTAGNLLLRTTYHYWYHTGENEAIRQMLGHTNRPQFVGDIDTEAPYMPH
jgi:hypothetical protein